MANLIFLCRRIAARTVCKKVNLAFTNIVLKGLESELDLGQT